MLMRALFTVANLLVILQYCCSYWPIFTAWCKYA